MPDNIFEQIANAIDPPEVVVDLRMQEEADFALESAPMPSAAMRGMAFNAETVVVVKQEAVGMYEVAVSCRQVVPRRSSAGWTRTGFSTPTEWMP